jgi:hypothetical protein
LDLALPEHHHENEQLGFVIAGMVTMVIGGEKRELHTGDTYAIPSHVPHSAVAGPDGATVTDVFAPVRADWAKIEATGADVGPLTLAARACFQPLTLEPSPRWGEERLLRNRPRQVR